MKNPATKCNTCQDFKFCPTGPVPVYNVKKEDIKCVVQFPQLPQKLVLLYEDQGLDYQMTLNIPAYTTTAKIYGQLSGLLEDTKNKQAAKKSKKGKRSLEQSEQMEFSFADVHVQFSLKRIFHAIYFD